MSASLGCSAKTVRGSEVQLQRSPQANGTGKQFRTSSTRSARDQTSGAVAAHNSLGSDHERLTVRCCNRLHLKICPVL